MKNPLLLLAVCFLIGMAGWATGKGADAPEPSLATLDAKLDQLLERADRLPDEVDLENLVFSRLQRMEEDLRRLQQDVTDIRTSVDRLR